jgi:hypothetical protein
MILTSMAGFGWLAWTSNALLAEPWSFAATAIGSIGLVGLDQAISSRSAFATVIVALVLIHFTGFTNPDSVHTKTIAPQLVALILEFCLIGMAGYRHSIAALSRYPLATYRSSPQCVVPAMDHAWDHPIKIDAN